MNWLVLTLFAIIARASYSVATKLLSNKVRVSPITQSFMLTTITGLFALVISPSIGGITFRGVEYMLFPILVMVASQAFGNVLFFRGIRHLDTGTGQIAFSSILVWGTMLSILFLGSKFSIMQLAGILLLMGAIVFIQYKKGRIELNGGFLSIVAAAALFAIFQVSSADLSKSLTTGTYLVLAYLGPSIVIGLSCFRDIRKDYTLIRRQLRNMLSSTIFASGTSLLYFIFSYLAYQQAPDRGVVVVLLTAQVILSVIFGIIFLRERENQGRKLLAGALAFLASVMIKSS